MPTDVVYEIIDGVRRSKASYLAGHTLILAEIDPGGPSRQIQVRIDSLRARFGVIDVSSTSAAKSRWDRHFKQQ
jgi:hypothetical protein